MLFSLRCLEISSRLSCVRHVEHWYNGVWRGSWNVLLLPIDMFTDKRLPPDNSSWINSCCALGCLAWFWFYRLLWLSGAVAAIGTITYPSISVFVSAHASPDQQGNVFMSSLLICSLVSLLFCVAFGSYYSIIVALLQSRPRVCKLKENCCFKFASE